jgi:hypothetical protein
VPTGYVPSLPKPPIGTKFTGNDHSPNHETADSNEPSKKGAATPLGHHPSFDTILKIVVDNAHKLSVHLQHQRANAA